MDKYEDFSDKIYSLEFEDKVVINGKVMFRNESKVPDHNLENGSFSFDFYTDWNKEENLFPRVSHIITFYYDKEKNVVDEKGVTHIGQGIFKVKLFDVATKKAEDVLSVETL